MLSSPYCTPKHPSPRNTVDLNKFKHDEGIASEGVWFEFDDAKLKIASSECRKYRNVLARQAAKKTKRSLRKDPATQDALLIDAMAEAILIDFKNINIAGQPLANTLENRKLILQSPEIRDFIAEQMQDVSNFQREQEQEETEQVGEPSGGGLPTAT